MPRPDGAVKARVGASTAVVVSVPPVGPLSASRSAPGTSLIAGRSVGCGAIRAARTGANDPARRAGRGGWEATRCRVAIGLLSAPNGDSPSTAKYRVAPREYTSLAKSDASPRATSGARYAGVPLTMPVEVRVTSSKACEMPKSVIFAEPSSPTRMFPGFTSRCTIPTRCAADSAAEISLPIRAASAGANGPCSRTTSCRLRDATYSMIRQGPSTASTTSNICTACGWCRRAVRRASRIARWTTRSRSLGDRPCCTCRLFTATARRSSSSRPSQTVPMPPDARRRSSR